MKMTALTSLIVAVAVAGSAQVFVVPAVTDDTPGVNESVWATEVQVIKVDVTETITVRRLWVCLREGGFLDDTSSAPTWEMAGPNPRRRLLTLLGSDLLQGTNSGAGAVALEISGGDVIVNARVADTSRGTQYGKTPFGQGQRIPTRLQPLIGPSFIPWLGGCTNQPCNLDPPGRWDFFRNNIGFVNPNPETLTLSAVVVPFGYDYAADPLEIEIFDDDPETFERVIPPYGWVQSSWTAKQFYGWSLANTLRDARAGFIVSFTPDSDQPYYGYASTVFSPDPESGVPAFNDPMFVLAEPGFVEPFQD